MDRPHLQTGGALGADSLFARCAHDAGHIVTNFSFNGHGHRSLIGFVAELFDLFRL